MSVELYIQGFNGGEPTGLSRADVARLFGAKDFSEEWVYSDPVGKCNCMCEFDDQDLVTSITIERPIGSSRLYSAVYGLLTSGPYIAYMPGSRPVAASAQMMDHLPEGMGDALGELIVVDDASSLEKALTEDAPEDEA